MKLPTILQLAKSLLIEFIRFEDNLLWYRATYEKGELSGTFDFPVPVEETAGGVFLAKDFKPLYFMRWMRKHLEHLSKAQDEAEADDAE